MAELLVLDPTIWGAVVVNNSLYLIPGQVGHTATADHETTDELYKCMYAVERCTLSLHVHKNDYHVFYH